MPYRPKFDPGRMRELNAERDPGGGAVRTDSGSAGKAKLAAGEFLKSSGRDPQPSWGFARTFSDHRVADPASFDSWGSKFFSTGAGMDFAPPPPMPPAEEGVL